MALDTNAIAMDPKDELRATNGDGEEGEISDDVQAKAVAETVKVQKDIKRPLAGDSGVYMPPAKRRQLEQQRAQEGIAANGNSLQLQRETWQNQKRAIHGTINRLNAGTIKPLIQELFVKVNLVRLRGVLCKSVMLAAVSSPNFSDVYAALISVINSKLPEVGELVVKRCILAYRRHYKRREKASCQAICIFLAHLFHQAVVHELIILQLLSVLLDGNPTDDSVEVAVQLLQVTGQALLDVSPAGVRACIERMRALLHEGKLNKRLEYKMEQLLKQRKTGFREFKPIADELDLVERDDQITHEMTLDDEEIKKEDHLDVFSSDPNFEENENEWAAIRGEILGEGDSSSDDSDDSDDDDSSASSSESEASEIPDQELQTASEPTKQLTVIQDLTEQDLIHLRRTIYLTIMSSATFEECTHKLAKIEIPDGREMELINMLIECCSQERTFLRYYGLISARFCLLNDRWKDAFMQSFAEQYQTIHRLETNKLRNVAKMFAHILHTDSIPWSVLSIIHLNEDETTSSSRIFIKIVIQEIAEAMGIAKVKQRFESNDEEMKSWFAGMFPKDNVRSTRYAINFFTSIGLGPLTDDLREFLKNAPKLILAKAKEAALAKKADDSDSSSVSSSSSSSTSTFSSSSMSTSSYSSSDDSVSTGSSDSYSSESRRGRSSRRRRRRYSSPSRSRSSYSSSSSRSYSSGSSESDRSRSQDRKRGSGSRRRRVSHSRSLSPPKEIRSDQGNRSPSPLPGSNDRPAHKGQRRKRRSTSESRSRSGDEKRGGRERVSSNSRSRSPESAVRRKGSSRKSRSWSPAEKGRKSSHSSPGSPRNKDSQRSIPSKKESRSPPSHVKERHMGRSRSRSASYSSSRGSMSSGVDSFGRKRRKPRNSKDDRGRKPSRSSGSPMNSLQDLSRKDNRRGKKRDDRLSDDGSRSRSREREVRKRSRRYSSSSRSSSRSSRSRS